MAQKSLKWISDSIPEADFPNADLDFSQIRFMANMAANDFRQKDEGSFVPILPYRSYKEYAEDTQRLLRDILNQMQFYQEQIENRQQKELLIDVNKNLNENIIQTGNLIVEATKAFEENQTDVIEFYGKHIQEIKAKNREYCTLMTSINKEIEKRNKALTDSITEFRHLCGAYMQRQLVDCVLNIVSNCFTGFASIKLPYGEYKDFEHIGDFYQMLQKIFTIADALDKVLSNGTKDIATFILAEKAYKEADNFEVEIPNDRDWDEFEAGSGKALFSDNGESWSQGVNAITPFAKWRISLPKVKTNKGIKFSTNHTTVKLTFVLQARISDIEDQLLQAQTLTVKELCDKMADIPNVLNGWDAVLNMDLEKINKSFEIQYAELSKSKEYSNQIDIETESKIGKNLYSVKQIQLQYGYPSISFLKNNDSCVALKMEILGGNIQYGIKQKKLSTEGTEDWSIEWEEEKSKIENAELSAQVPLSFAKGSTSGSGNGLWEVKLCFSKGTFSVEKMDLDPVEEVDVAKGIKSHFQTHDIEYIINQIDLTNYGVSHALTPSEFLFKMLQPSKSKQILQLFIQTNGRKALDASLAYLNDVSNPLPENKDVSLMISNEVLYRDLLPEAFNQTTSWKMTGVKPDKEEKQWSAKFQEGSLQVKGLDLSSMTWNNIPIFGCKSYEHSYMETENGVEIPMKNANVSESKKGTDSETDKLYFSLNVENEEYQFYHIRTRHKKEVSKKKYSRKFSLHMNASMQFTISGQGREQTIGIGEKSFKNSAEFNVGAAQDPGCGMPDFEERLEKLVEDTLPDLIVKELNTISFTDLSVFALQNFIFPAKRYISFHSISAPRALLLVGMFEDEKAEETET